MAIKAGPVRKGSAHTKTVVLKGPRSTPKSAGTSAKGNPKR